MIQCSNCGRDLKGSLKPLEPCPCKKEKNTVQCPTCLISMKFKKGNLFDTYTCPICGIVIDVDEPEKEE